jgi:hypothetical protein
MVRETKTEIHFRSRLHLSSSAALKPRWLFSLR